MTRLTPFLCLVTLLFGCSGIKSAEELGLPWATKPGNWIGLFEFAISSDSSGATSVDLTSVKTRQYPTVIHPPAARTENVLEVELQDEDHQALEKNTCFDPLHIVYESPNDDGSFSTTHVASQHGSTSISMNIPKRSCWIRIYRKGNTGDSSKANLDRTFDLSKYVHE